uniref:Uncharacterized protein n=1 Tax=blood disease bacterium R229 TaxID=741978 RepID=G2ZM70_9RALS|nr:hypothetical protein BDB_80577 [blood disease bacterium R229]
MVVADVPACGRLLAILDPRKSLTPHQNKSKSQRMKGGGRQRPEEKDLGRPSRPTCDV